MESDRSDAMMNSPLGVYEELYENHAIKISDAENVGGGDFEKIGLAQLQILKYFGLREDSYILDFGCGTGRLGKHAISYLKPRRYVGTDISPTMLQKFKMTLGEVNYYSLYQQVDYDFAFTNLKFDFISAFSVFTHMEIEDTARYLKSIKEVSSPGTRLIASVLEWNSELGRQVFEEQMNLDFQDRWKGVRNFMTCKDHFLSISESLGWSLKSWIGGDLEVIPIENNPKAKWKFGQSLVVLELIR